MTDQSLPRVGIRSGKWIDCRGAQGNVWEWGHCSISWLWCGYMIICYYSNSSNCKPKMLLYVNNALVNKINIKFKKLKVFPLK